VVFRNTESCVDCISKIGTGVVSLYKPRPFFLGRAGRFHRPTSRATMTFRSAWISPKERQSVAAASPAGAGLGAGLEVRSIPGCDIIVSDMQAQAAEHLLYSSAPTLLFILGGFSVRTGKPPSAHLETRDFQSQSQLYF
jgi:hypothetical protein